MTGIDHVQRWRDFLGHCSTAVTGASTHARSGYLTRVAGLVMEAVGLRLPVGSGCTVFLPDGQNVQAEVVGFSGERLYLMPQHDVYGLAPGARVAPADPVVQPPLVHRPCVSNGGNGNAAKQLPVGAGLLGRVVDGNGEPLDRLGPLLTDARVALQSRPINPLERKSVPHTNHEIAGRVNEITFNSALMTELRGIEFVNRLIDQGRLPHGSGPDQYRRINVHRIALEPMSDQIAASSKLRNDFQSLELLRKLGTRAARRFLDSHFDEIGVKSSVDFRTDAERN